ncbi:MAG TPA: hydrogenase maturation nickel metallochaperone HypA [Terriglobales bacterium]|nr:hydrogenase maturation nickel metallochaperone HypA [Terriglobales bacterium]
MHELSLALSLIEVVEEQAAARGGLRVRAVRLRVGTLAGVSDEALAFAYEIACEGTALAGSRLVTETTAGRELEVVGLEVDP